MGKLFTKDAVEVCERTLIAVAAVFALFPMWQYYSEREDRQLDRAANLILAHETCLKFTYEDVFLATPSPELSGIEKTMAEIEIISPHSTPATLAPELLMSTDPDLAAALIRQRQRIYQHILRELDTPSERGPTIDLPEDEKLRIRDLARQILNDRMVEVAGAYAEACDAVSQMVLNSSQIN